MENSMPTIGVRKIDNPLGERYGYRILSLEIDGEDSGKRILVRQQPDGRHEFVNFVTESYVLLPNEVAVEIADEVARELGAVPFSEFTGDWFSRMDKHVIEYRHQVHALYAWNEPVDLGGGDNIQLGFAVHNSVDSSLAFSIGLFTFRHACKNMVFMGYKGRGMDFDNRDVLSYFHRNHSKGLRTDTAWLKAKIMDIIQKGLQVTETYKRWKQEHIDPRTAEKLHKVLPRKVLPEWLQVKQVKEIQIPQATTVWDTYNDITEKIWHNAKTTMETKQNLFKQLHRVLVPAVGVR